MFNEIKPEEYRKKITFSDSVYGKIANVNKISRTLTNDLKTQSFTDIQEIVTRKNVNLKRELLKMILLGM